MNDGKYIIIQEMGCSVPVLFSSLIDHSHFLQCWHKTLIVSAGFFQVYSDQDNHDYHYVETFGNSITLEIESHPKDKDIIEKFLNR